MSNLSFFFNPPPTPTPTPPLTPYNLELESTGDPGSLHDSRVLRNSNIFRMAENGGVLSWPDDVIENARISPLILGDGGYPIMKWLVTPYTFSPNLTVTEKKLHKTLSSARVTSGRAYGMLKARWQYLLNNLDCQIETTVYLKQSFNKKEKP